MFQTFDESADGSHGPERLARLREALAEAGVDGLLVPRADAHQGEVVAPRDERLAWLTGFTGSAGSAVVLPDRALLFVDGRYTLQAARQSDAAVFEVVAVHETTPETWLRREVRSGLRLGYDPWLHGKAEIDRLTKALHAAGADLVGLDRNPIDQVWLDQPSEPTGAVQIQPDDVAGESAEAKRGRAVKKLAEAGVDALVITLPENIAWLLNIRGGDLSRSPVALGFAILAADGTAELIMEPDKFDGEVLTHLGTNVGVTPPEGFGKALARLEGKRVLIDERTCPLWVAGQLSKAGAETVWGNDPVTALKAPKNPAELAGMRAAHLRDGQATVRFLAWLDRAVAATESLTEIDVVQALERFRRETGLLMDLAFDTICGSGPNGAIVHYRVNRSTNRTIAPGELLLVDSGGQYQDGTTDITRTLAIGEPPEAAIKAFTLVLKGMINISTARWPVGLTGRDLDPLAREHLWRAGLDYDHGTGHGVGVYLNVHEGPASLSRRGDKAALEPGMILSNEPGCYREGLWGIRIENLVIVAEASLPEGGTRDMLGFETLTLCPIERRLIDPALLGGNEAAWLDAYHARVREALTPGLDETDAAWLAAATRPLGDEGLDALPEA